MLDAGCSMQDSCFPAKCGDDQDDEDEDGASEKSLR
jgi:hypothetical protein